MKEVDVVHPDVDRLAAYALGSLDDPEMDEIESHLSVCDSCCEVIRDQPENPLLAKLRGRATWQGDEQPAEVGSSVEPRSSFQVPSSFILGTAPQIRGQETVTDPLSDKPALAAFPKELIDHARYRIIAALGSGGMGTVYRAEHRLMDRAVALKVIRGDLLGNEAMVERFRREVKAAARLASHPNIVAAYDAEQAGETHMLVMELIEGTDLARVVDRRGPLPAGEACEYARQAAVGLQHALEDGMVHRDIKPQNLMRTTRGQIKILDFGLARFASEVASHSGLTGDGMVLGSADYIAPEQIEDPHAADIRADIYSLGCALYFLLAGRPPFPDGSVIQKLLAHSEKTPKPLEAIRTDVPPKLAEIVERMMAKDPARRFQTPDEVAQALVPFADAQSARAAAMDLDATAGADASTISASARRQESPTHQGWRRFHATTIRATLPSLDSTRGDERPEHRTAEADGRVRRTSLPFAAALAMLAAGAASLALITYRIQTPTGELVIETDDPAIEVIIKQGGQQVSVVDPQSKNIVELKEGRYELQLPGGSNGLKLSADTLTLKRGEKTVVSVRRENAAQVSNPQPASDLLAGAGSIEVGEIARFESPHDHVSQAYLLPNGRNVVYSTCGDLKDDQWVDGVDAAIWLGDLADPKNPRKLASFTPGPFSLSVSRDGRLALTAASDKVVRIWDIETGKSRRVRHFDSKVGRVAFAPDDRHAAYVYGDTIRYCDLKTGDELTTFRGHSGRIRTFAFCGDGRRLVSGGIDDHTIRVWNVETGEEIRRMRHSDGVMSVAVFPDNRRVLSGSWDRTIGVWDLETGRQLRRITGVANQFGAHVAVCPDGRRALFATQDHMIHLWDLETGDVIERFEGHTSDPWEIGFSADGQRAVSASSDKTARVWALPPGRPPGEKPPIVEVAHFIGHDDFVESNLAISPDGRRLLSGSGDKTLILWDCATAQPIRRFKGHTDHVKGVAISPDGRSALSGGNDKVIRLWNLESGDTVRELRGHTDWVFSVAFSSDGRRAFSTSGGYYHQNSWQDGTDSAIRVWDLESGQEIRKLEGHKGLVWNVAVSPDGRYLLSGGSDMSLILWDAASGVEIRRLKGHMGTVNCTAFLPDGRHAVSSGQDRTIRLWDLETGREIHCVRGHATGVTWVAVSPDGRRLLSSDMDGHELRLWDVEARKQVHRIHWATAAPTRGCFSPDGQYAYWAGMDGVIRKYRLSAIDPGKTESTGAAGEAPASKR